MSTYTRDAKVLPIGWHKGKFTSLVNPQYKTTRLRFTVFDELNEDLECVASNETFNTEFAKDQLEEKQGFNFAVKLGVRYCPKNKREYNTITKFVFRWDVKTPSFVKMHCEKWQALFPLNNVEYQKRKAKWPSEELKVELRKFCNDQLRTNQEFRSRIKSECEAQGLDFSDRSSFQLDHHKSLHGTNYLNKEEFHRIKNDLDNIKALSPEDNNRKWAN
jgi:hypothetical protein